MDQLSVSESAPSGLFGQTPGGHGDEAPDGLRGNLITSNAPFFSFTELSSIEDTSEFLFLVMEIILSN